MDMRWLWAAGAISIIAIANAFPPDGDLYLLEVHGTAPATVVVWADYHDGGTSEACRTTGNASRGLGPRDPLSSQARCEMAKKVDGAAHTYSVEARDPAHKEPRRLSLRSSARHLLFAYDGASVTVLDGASGKLLISDWWGEAGAAQ